MRRFAVSFVALALLSVFLALPVRATSTAVHCANPTVLTGYEDGIAFPGGYRVNLDGWTHTGQYTMSVCNEHDWSSVAKVKTGLKQVRAYNASESTMTDWSSCASQHPMGSYTKLKSSYSYVAPDAGSYDYAYDLFAGSGACSRPLTEVMLFSRWRDVDLPAPQLTPTIGGVKYEIYWAPFNAAELAATMKRVPELARSAQPMVTGGNYIQMRLVDQADRADVNWKHIFKYLASEHLIVLSDTLVFLRGGVEILSTYNKPVTFALTGFKVTTAF